MKKAEQEFRKAIESREVDEDYAGFISGQVVGMYQRQRKNRRIVFSQAVAAILVMAISAFTMSNFFEKRPADYADTVSGTQLDLSFQAEIEDDELDQLAGM